MANRIVLNTISYHGKGAVENIVPELTARGYHKAFVCSDPDLLKFGVTYKVTSLLDAAGFPYEIYSEIKPNPTIENVQHGVAAFQHSGADCIVAIGGGSSMDTAKAVGIIANNPEFADVRSLEGVAPTKKHAVFTIAVPTTAGTAAEVTINYVITDVEKKRKFVCVDTNDIPEIAVVDPDMMATMPKGLTAATGMDALTHAIEGYITKGAWEMTDMFHLEAIRLISKYLRASVAGEAEGREGMALGAVHCRAWASRTWAWALCTAWPTRWALCTTRRTAWPTPFCCPPSWSTTPPARVKNTAKLPSAMGVEGVDAMSQEEYRAAAMRRCEEAEPGRGHPCRPERDCEGRGRAVPGRKRLCRRLPPGQPARHQRGGDCRAVPQPDVRRRPGRTAQHTKPRPLCAEGAGLFGILGPARALCAAGGPGRAGRLLL